jgi:Leucine-rich repeat (LRR) protein
MNFQHNQLYNLPAEIGSMTTLTHLWLESNQLEYIPLEMHQLKVSFAFKGNQRKLVSFEELLKHFGTEGESFVHNSPEHKK